MFPVWRNGSMGTDGGVWNKPPAAAGAEKTGPALVVRAAVCPAAATVYSGRLTRSLPERVHSAVRIPKSMVLLMDRVEPSAIEKWTTS